MAGLVAGMAAGADSIDDMDVLRHGAMPELSGGIRAPSTLGSFLHVGTWGNVRRLDAVARQFLGALAAGTPLLPSAPACWRSLTWTRMQKRVYGHAKQGAGFGHTKIQAAPRGALLYPRLSREELGGRFLGLMAYLELKGEGNSSMPGN